MQLLRVKWGVNHCGRVLTTPSQSLEDEWVRVERGLELRERDRRSRTERERVRFDRLGNLNTRAWMGRLTRILKTQNVGEFFQRLQEKGIVHSENH